MKIFEIVDYNGNVVEYVKAYHEKQALCIYIANHEELIDVMLWKAPSGIWKLAIYNCEDFFWCARKSHDL